MIHLMLNNLCCPAGEVFHACLHFQGMILHLNCFIAFTLTRAAEKQQTTFLRIVSAVLLDDFGIEYHHVCRSSFTLIEKCDDAFANTDHICCHTDTIFSVCHQRIKQVLCDLQIFFHCDLRLSHKDRCIVCQFFLDFLIPSDQNVLRFYRRLLLLYRAHYLHEQL